MQASSPSASGAMLAPSHNTSHRRKSKRASDPFLELSDEAIKLPSQGLDGSAHEDTSAPSESLLADVCRFCCAVCRFPMANAGS